MFRSTAPSTRQIAGRALLVGIAAGMRSAMPTGVMAAGRDDASFRAGWKDWPVFRSRAGQIALRAGTAGEVIGDKLPLAPARTKPDVLIGRIVSGAFAGIAVGTTRRGKGATVTGALCGIVGAAAGSYGGYAYRTNAVKITGLPDLPFALLEDIAAYLLARKGIRG